MFDDRQDAGRQLANGLHGYAPADSVVLAIPRGGVPVAAEVADALGAALDVMVVRKLGVPPQPELGFGAIGEGGLRVLNDQVISGYRLSDADVDAVTAVERGELERRVRRYRGGRRRISVGQRTVILVDDGIATGYTVRAAVRLLRQEGAAVIVVAVPVAPAQTIRQLATVADVVVCLTVPRRFTSVGEAYASFDQVSDQEVQRALAAPSPR